MVMDRLLNSFFDEMEKIGVSVRMSDFMQTRAGRRPIRAEKLLSRPTLSRTPQEDKTLAQDGERESHKDYEVEGGPGMVEAPGEGRI